MARGTAIIIIISNSLSLFFFLYQESGCVSTQNRILNTVYKPNKMVSATMSTLKLGRCVILAIAAGR